MSLILNNDSSPQWKLYDSCPIDDLRDAAMLDRYLAILENNKKSSRFVPDDALVALDMAGFVRGQIDKSRHPSQVSAARLALALVHPAEDAPLQ